MMKRAGTIAILILAFCGLADAAYLAEHVASGAPVICNIQGLSDCNTVIGSQYSRLFGLPLADLGVLFYGIIFTLAALELLISEHFLRRLLQLGAVLGCIASVYFVVLQAFVIRAFCAYCLVSAAITLLLTFVATGIEPVWSKEEGAREEEEPQHEPPAPPRLTMPPAP